RQVVFLAGEPGIGKTTVLEAFLADCTRASAASPRSAPPVTLIARGQCIEHYGTAEAYLPLLDALGDLCRSAAADSVVPVLRRVAPTWLAQLPWLIEEADRAELDRELRGVTSGRMLRELAQALETVAQHQLLVLALEDLHWSDSATADLLAFLARRPSPARLMVLASYRPVDAILTDNPIRSVHHELQRQNRCQAISIDALPAADVGELVARRFNAAPFADELAAVVNRRTEGHPLFIVSMLDDLVLQGRISRGGDGWQIGGRLCDIEGSVPDGMLQMVRIQVDRLAAEERAVVEAASVVGASFSSAAVAAALQRDLVEVEGLCEAMARRAVLLDRTFAAAWPDGTSASSYSFRHALYCDALYKGIPAARRRRLHERIGDRLEQGFAKDVAAAAVLLGRHFEEAGDHARAARHLRHASEVAARRGAPREALALIARTRTHLAHLPESNERTVEELMVEIAAGPALAAVEGYASLEVERIFTRAREKCRALGDGSQLFPVLWGLWSFWCVRGRIGDALELARQLHEMAALSGDPEMILEGHHAMWVTLFFRGDIGECGRHLDAALALYDRSHHHVHVMMYGQDPGVVARAYRCLVLQAQGREREAVAEGHAAMELGRSLGHHVSLIFGVGFLGWMHMESGDAARCRPLVDEVLEIASTNGLAFWQAHGTWIVSRALAATDPAAGIAGMRAGMEALDAIGARMGFPGYLAALARTVLVTGDLEEARRLVEEARLIGEDTGEFLGRADVLRLRGDLELSGAGADADGGPLRAEAFYREAVELARRQEATRLELQAALDLARLLRELSRDAEAVALLAPILERLPPGEGQPEIREARSFMHD
ncbi:MAG: AAA family ATPase, partial [Candidatus Binatia bacterium]